MQQVKCRCFFYVRVDVKIQVAATATVAAVCKRRQYYFFNLGQFEQSNIDTYCFNMIVYAYLNN